MWTICKGVVDRSKVNRGLQTHDTGSRATRQAMFNMSNRCLACDKDLDPFAAAGAPDGMHIDHVVPSSKGGADHLSNYQPLCTSCNTSKGNRSSKDYRTDAMRALHPTPQLLLEDQRRQLAERQRRDAEAEVVRRERLINAGQSMYAACTVAEGWTSNIPDIVGPQKGPDSQLVAYGQELSAWHRQGVIRRRKAWIAAHPLRFKIGLRKDNPAWQPHGWWTDPIPKPPFHGVPGQQERGARPTLPLLSRPPSAPSSERPPRGRVPLPPPPQRGRIPLSPE
jgi:hypothetical protein